MIDFNKWLTESNYEDVVRQDGQEVRNLTNQKITKNAEDKLVKWVETPGVKEMLTGIDPVTHPGFIGFLKKVPE